MTAPARRIRLDAPAAIAVMLAMAACQSQAPQASAPDVITRSGGARGAGAPPAKAPEDPQATLARNLGLLAPVGAVTPAQIQTVTAGGQPVAGAEIIVGDLRALTDAQGLVNLPPEVAKLGRQPAVIRAPGYMAVEQDVIPGFAVQLSPVDAQRTTITAAAGGTAMNAAGNLEVVFPPGSLSGDTRVAVTRAYGQWGLPGQRLPQQMPFTMSTEKDGKPFSFTDAGYKLADNVPLGTYQYGLDLGEGVSVAPGAKVVVRFKAEGPMAALLDARYKAGDTFAQQTESVTRDAAGHYWLAMQMVGPNTASVIATGGAGAAPPLRRRLMAAQCQSFTDQEPKTFWVKKQWASMTPGIEIPIWVNGYRTSNNVSADWVNQYAASSGGGCTTSGTAAQYEGGGTYNMATGSSIPGWVTLVTHNPGVNGGRCVYYQFDPNQYYCEGGRIKVKDPGGEWQTTYTQWNSKSINALVNWNSDDPRISGPVAGARVNFNHSVSPMRAGTALSLDSGSDGYASTTGVEGSNGSVSASLPGQAGFTFGSTSGYLVDCRTVDLRIHKNMPRVELQPTVNGASPGAVTLKTSLGDFPLSAVVNTTVKPSIPLNSPSASFSVNGAYQPSASEWVEMSSAAVDAGWNTTKNLPTTFWFSRSITASLVYESNDASQPAESRPASVWNGQAVSGADLTFSHPQSAYAGKTRQEPLSFTNLTGNATTWGLSGAASSITAQRSANGVTLSGTASASVNGTTVNLPLNANLPRLTLRASGNLSGKWEAEYDLVAGDGSLVSKRVTLQPQGTTLVFNLPVEDPLNQPGKHTFRLKSVASEDGANRLLMPDGGMNYPEVTGVYRGALFLYPVELKSTFVAPK
ncbi:MAG: hypothetical protein VKP62_14535 [Candidatus Sericytochromatia bacterium]|nr:hypothetical protein [Candidatus Sericytochromatia bacterium]